MHTRDGCSSGKLEVRPEYERSSVQVHEALRVILGAPVHDPSTEGWTRGFTKHHIGDVSSGGTSMHAGSDTSMHVGSDTSIHAGSDTSIHAGSGSGLKSGGVPYPFCSFPPERGSRSPFSLIA